MGYKLVNMVVHEDPFTYRSKGEEKTLSLGARYLLTILAHMAKDESLECWPSQKWLAKKLGVETDRQVRRLVKELIESGRIQITRKSNSPLHSNHTFIQLPPYQTDEHRTNMSGETLNASIMLAPDTGQNCPMAPDINVQNHRTKMSGKNKAKAKRKKRRDAQSALASESLRSAGGQGPTSLRSGLRSSLCSVEEEEGGSAPPTPPSAVSGCGAKPEKSDNPANPNLGNKGHVGESAESSVTPTNGSGGGAGVLASKSNYEEDKFNKIFFEKDTQKFIINSMAALY